MSAILTLAQFADREQRAAAANCNVTLAEVLRCYPREHYSRDWTEYTEKAFDAGGEFATRAWRALPDWHRRRILRSTRALRDDDLTRRYIWLTSA